MTRRITLVLVALALLCMGGCRSTPDASALAQIVIEPAPGNALFHQCSIDLTDVTVYEDAFPEPLSGHKAGEPCFVLTGHISNGYEGSPFVTMFALGYDASGEVVAWTLDRGLSTGAILLEIDYNHESAFAMRLNRPGGVAIVRIFAQAYDAVPEWVDWQLLVGACRSAKLSESATVSQVPVDPRPVEMLFDAGPIVLEDVALDLGAFDAHHHGYEEGDPCLLLAGHITNLDPENRYVVGIAWAFDAAGDLASGVVDNRPVFGVLDVDLDCGCTGPFTIQMELSEDVRRIRLYASTSSYPVP